MKIIVQEILEESRLSIRAAAKKCGLPYSTLADICANKVMPRLDTLEIIASGLNCNVEKLYKVTDIPFSPSQLQEDMVTYRCNLKRDKNDRKKAVCTDDVKKLKEDIKELIEMIYDGEKLKRIYKILKYFFVKT